MVREVKLAQIRDKATNNCPIQDDSGEILQFFTFPNGLTALELAFYFLGRENDRETVACSIEPRHTVEKML